MSIQELEARFNSSTIEQSVNIILEAFEYGDSSLNLLCLALKNESQEIRAAAQIVLTEINSTSTQEVLWNYLPFNNFCNLYQVNTRLLEKAPRSRYFSLDYVSISNYKNLLFCYWSDGDNHAHVSTWSLRTGMLTHQSSLRNSHSLCLGNRGKTGVSNDYYIHLLDVETHYFDLLNLTDYPCTDIPNSCLAACPGSRPLAAFWDHVTYRTEIELWNYQTGQEVFRYVNMEDYCSADRYPPDTKSREVCFSPDGDLLIAKFYIRQDHIPQGSSVKAVCSLKVWDTNSAELIHDATSNFQPISGCSQHPEAGFLLYGLIEQQVTIQGLFNDKILFQQPGKIPCHMTLDGRVIAFCTDNSEVEVWDWKRNHKLTTLSHQTGPLLNIEISQDREFIITHSQDSSIKIWGIP